MTPRAQLALAIFVPLAVSFFVLMRPRRAVLATMLIAWLFLPDGAVQLSRIPPIDKVMLSSAISLLGLIVFAPDKLMGIRWSLLDIPIFLVTLSPILSSMSNDLGLYDGVSTAVHWLPWWGMPYVIGRALFSEMEALRDLGKALCIAGLAYVPVCLYELRMSPILHANIYGYMHIRFLDVMRAGGWRPVGFVPGGLSLGILMATCCLCTLALWRGKLMRGLYGIPFVLFFVVLLGIFMVSKATGAILLFFCAIIAFFATRYFKTRWLLIAMLIVIPPYLGFRLATNWDGREVIDFVRTNMSEFRADSLKTRFDNEVLLVEKGLEQKWLGWGGWGRYRITDETGKDITTVDSLWIIEFGERGIVGLASVFTLLILPGLVLAWRVKPRLWRTPDGGLLLAMALSGWLYASDKVLNAMPIPILNVMLAGVLGFAIHATRKSSTKVKRIATQPVNTNEKSSPTPSPGSTRHPQPT